MSIKGKKIVFTGKLSKKRSVLTEEAEKAGADVVDAISSKVDILVCGANVEGHSKYQEAQDLGIECIDEDEYRRRLSGKKAKRQSNSTTSGKQSKSSKASKTADISAKRLYDRLTKSKLVAALEKIGDTIYRKSWTKGKLVEQLDSHNTKKVLKSFTSSQLQVFLSECGLSTTGKKSEQIERLLNSLQSSESAPIVGKECLTCRVTLHSMNRGETNYCRECNPMDPQAMMVVDEDDFEELADMFGEELARMMLF